MGNQTAANRPYELGLTSKYNKYTLERARARMGRCADENGTAKAFSQLEIANYKQPQSLAYIVAVTSHLGVKVSDYLI